MSVTLDKLSDQSPCGGHNSRTFYVKTYRGTVPENILNYRRHHNGARITMNQASELSHNHLCLLWGFLGGRL